MTGPDPIEAMREAAREVLGDLMRGLVGDETAPPRVDRHGHDAPFANGHASHAPNVNGHPNRVGDVAVPANRTGQAGDDAPRRPSATSDDAVIVPQVPAPPVAAVLRPSTWSGPAVAGEVIGDRPPERAHEQGPHSGGLNSPPAGMPAGSMGRPSPRPTAAAGVTSDGRVEPVTIHNDDDLQRFVRALVGRLENPRDRQAIRAGRLRFALRQSTATAVAAGNAPSGGQVAAARVVKGAVTERAVRAAAADGTRLVLAHGAVLTPLARDCARARGVEIERERRC